VTDPKGNPIKGLGKDAFEITEDGKEQDIRSFHEAAEPQSVPPQTPAPTSSKQSPNVFTNAPQFSDPGSVMMILLDLLNTPVADQQFARQELIKFLKDRPAKSQFALAVMTGDTKAPLQMLQGFTPDENLLLAALNRGRAAPTMTRWQTAHDTGQDSARTVRELTQGDSLYKAWQALLHGLEISQEVEQSIDTEVRIRTTAGTLVQLSTYLAGIPGRKSLVWLSGSFPVSLPVGVNSQTVGTSTRSYTRLVEQLSNLLAQSQIAVYPVYIRGMDAASDMSASVSTFAPLHSSATTSISAFADPGPVSPYHQQALEQMSGLLNEHMALDRIASATGGKAFYNANAIEDAISTASEQAANYYTISYTPSNKNYDGRFRKIKVTLPDKHLHLYYRPGYFADDSASPRDIAHNIRVVAMQHGSPQSRQIHFSVRVAPVGARTKIASTEAGEVPPASTKKSSPALIEVQRHSIDFAISGSDLRFVSLANGSYQSALTFMIASFDSEGRPLTGVASVSTTDTQPGDYRQILVGGFRAHQEVNVPVEATSLRIGVQDQATGYIGTVDIPLPVPTPPDLPKLVKHRLPEIEPD
jgi:VWFA-related protein